MEYLYINSISFRVTAGLNCIIQKQVGPNCRETYTAERRGNIDCRGVREYKRYLNRFHAICEGNKFIDDTLNFIF